MLRVERAFRSYGRPYFQREITAAFTYPDYHSNCPAFGEVFPLSEGAVVAGSQVEIGARDPQLSLGLLPWRLTGPRVFIVERFEAMPLVMFPAPSLPSDEIARFVTPSTKAQSFPTIFSTLHWPFHSSSSSIAGFGSAVDGLEGQPTSFSRKCRP
jgi:hypothetical protein